MPALTTLVRGATESTATQFLRYSLVGGIAFLVDFGALYALTDLVGLPYLVSAALAFLLGLCTNYALSISWVFSSRKLGNRWLEFGVFALIGLVGLGLNELIIWQCTETFGLHYLASKVVSAGIVLFWNFFARKYALFKRSPDA